jgi:glycosyltransferase involved in cell wall biosynthesis
VKVTFVCAGGLGLEGGQRAIAIYADGLRRRGHTVLLVIQPVRPKSVPQRLRELLRGRSPQPPRVRGRARSHIRDLDVPYRLLDRHRPMVNEDVPDADVVVATWWETAEWVWRLSPTRGRKAHLVQSYETWGGPPDRVDATHRLPIARIVTAPWLADLLAERFGQPPIACLPPSVEHRNFCAPPRSKQAHPTVGFQYATLHIKGTDVVLRAYQLAREVIPDLRLVCYGSMPVSSELPLPVGARFVYRADDEQLRELYSQCDAWLFGSRLDGVGFPILEAMACRTPVIGGPAGVAPQLLADGAGVLVPPEDPEAMARAIVSVCQLSDRGWQELSQAAFERASRHTWERAVDQLDAALQQVREPIRGTLA